MGEQTKGFGEPWSPYEPEFNYLVSHERAVACVNACAGMNDPKAEVAALREQVTHLMAVDKACVLPCDGCHGTGVGDDPIQGRHECSYCDGTGCAETEHETDLRERAEKAERERDEARDIYRGAVLTLRALADWNLSALHTVNEDYQQAVDAVVARVMKAERELSEERACHDCDEARALYRKRQMDAERERDEARAAMQQIEGERDKAERERDADRKEIQRRGHVIAEAREDIKALACALKEIPCE